MTPLRTVQKIVTQWKDHGNVDVKPKSGRLRTVNTQKMRGIAKKIQRNDGASLNEMTQELSISLKSLHMMVCNETGLRVIDGQLLNGQLLNGQTKKSP
ncbi:hypothetical protein NECAME_05973 [Necator americanus]|uniref:Uncharacterized protein n=1 Tax=Necator americanus TaxID=51031 RepID=W2TX15_NECAM|nr:hypothetical protein NECAME_05973 [Necator americanus]ETN86358.1 hypothetical protein NECAME_05973 [Necator americanus]